MSTPPSPPPPPGGGYQPGPDAGGPVGPTSEERTWALASHIGALVAWSVGMGFLAPLVIMLVKGDSSPYIRRHAVESLNFQISLVIYGIVSAVLVIILVGFVLLVLLAIFALVAIILATVAASDGRDYRYPLTIRFIS